MISKKIIIIENENCMICIVCYNLNYGIYRICNDFDGHKWNGNLLIYKNCKINKNNHYIYILWGILIEYGRFIVGKTKNNICILINLWIWYIGM